MDPLPDDEAKEVDELQDQLETERKMIKDAVENGVRQAFGH